MIVTNLFDFLFVVSASLLNRPKAVIVVVNNVTSILFFYDPTKNTVELIIKRCREKVQKLRHNIAKELMTQHIIVTIKEK